LSAFGHLRIGCRDTLAILTVRGTIMKTKEFRRSLYGLMSALAQSGDYMDCAAIEAKLRTIGFSADQAREALSDADDRAALLALCIAARKPLCDEQRIKDDAAFRQLVAKL
jgi:hypothetical protein